MYVRQASWVEGGPAGSPVAALRARGVGAIGDEKYCAGASRWDPIAWFACFGRDVANVASGSTPADFLPPPALPPPAAPTLTTDPAAANLPDAAYFGTDYLGNPVYAVPESTAQNMAVYKASVDTFMNQQGARTPVSATPAGWLLPVGIAAAALLGLAIFKGGRR